MKKSSRTAQKPQYHRDNTDKDRKNQHNHLEMNRFARRSLVLLLFILMAAILFAGYASLYPVAVTLNTPVLDYQREGKIDYSVLVQSNSFSNQTSLDMDQVYLEDFAKGVDAAFQYNFRTLKSISLLYKYRIDATLQVLDSADPANLLLSKTFNLTKETSGQFTGSELQLNETAHIDLADYDRWIRAFANQSDVPVSYVLSVAMAVQVESPLPGGDYLIADAPALLIPLDQQQFRLTSILPSSQPVKVWQPLSYQLVLAPIPFPFYPAAAGVCFLLIVIILSTTRSRRKDHFNRDLRRMMRKARSRLMVIGDKAWEPEWCITATDFRSMVRTAKKLKHPLFCFVDRKSENPAAYFYIYFGENNYCFILGKPAAASAQNREEPADGESAAANDADDSIPLLPETDDSPEIMLAKLKIQTGFNR